jgi:hypothetical protein
MIKPYSDDYLTYNENTGRYVLTTKNLLENYGINLDSSANSVGAQGILNMVSISIYNFIHKHNFNNEKQDYMIASTEKGRKIINDAMCMQFMYIRQAGYLSRSTDKDKRAMAIDEDAKEILSQVIPEFGCSVLYCGVL